MIAVNLSLSFGSSAGNKLSMDANIDDLFFVFNPLPLLYAITSILKISDIPRRDLHFEERIPFLYEYNVSKISKLQKFDPLRSSKLANSNSTIGSIKTDLDDATISSQANGIDSGGLLFSSSNFSFNITCTNSSIILLTDPHVFRQNILSLNLAEANVVLASNPDDESISVSLNQIVVCCASLSGDSRVKGIEKSLYQNFLDIEKVEAHYRGSYQNNDQPNSTEIKDSEEMKTLSDVDFVDVNIFVKVENSQVYVSSLLYPLILGCNEVRG